MELPSGITRKRPRGVAASPRRDDRGPAPSLSRIKGRRIFGRALGMTRKRPRVGVAAMRPDDPRDAVSKAPPRRARKKKAFFGSRAGRPQPAKNARSPPASAQVPQRHRAPAAARSAPTYESAVVASSASKTRTVPSSQHASTRAGARGSASNCQTAPPSASAAARIWSRSKSTTKITPAADAP